MPQKPILPKPLTQKQLDSRLCYIDRSTTFAYFANAEPKNITGDDWDDAPYEYNAGAPYNYDIIVAFNGPRHYQPCEGFVNSSYTVDTINSGSVPWLYNPYDAEVEKIYAGITLRKFIQIIKKFNGEVYLPIGEIDGK